MSGRAGVAAMGVAAGPMASVVAMPIMAMGKPVQPMAPPPRAAPVQAGWAPTPPVVAPTQPMVPRDLGERAWPSVTAPVKKRKPGCNGGLTDLDNHPINCVDWAQAVAFCRSRSAVLPTEAQWEYAARGTDGRTYPWGNDAPGSQLCWNRDPTLGPTCPVNSYPSGNSPFGLSDMAGNVWEWTADWYATHTAQTGSSISGHASKPARPSPPNPIRVKPYGSRRASLDSAA